MNAKPLWSGGFKEKMHSKAVSFNESVSFDHLLADYDITASIAHVTMLSEVGLVSGDEAKRIIDGLKEIRAETAAGKFEWDVELEDVHMNIEASLKKKIGSVGGKLHTARSRNDQVALDMRLWMRDSIDAASEAISGLMRVLAAKAKEYYDAVMPGYTHLQRAMPVTAGHHLLAYVEAFARDRERLSECRHRVNRLPLGAAALAGTGLPIDRRRVAELLNFETVLENSMDAVAARDHLIEFAACLANLFLTVSRLCEDAIFWHSSEAGFATVGEEFLTGSSIMPQKKNPDFFELLRGKSSGVAAALFQLVVLTKAQPMAYNRDLQEDKPLLFSSAKTVIDGLELLADMMKTIKFDRARMLDACRSGHMDAIAAADWLVRKGVPFREAHEAVGKLVRKADERGCSLAELDDADLSSAHDKLDVSVREILGAEKMVWAYSSYGAANPKFVLQRAEYRLSELSED